MHPGHLLRVFAAYRDGRYGDLAAYKAAASGIRARPGVAAALERLQQPIPEIDLPAFRRMPAGSLGRSYADFIDSNGFQPLHLSAPARERLGRSSTLAVRYAVLHDAFHVLLGFGAGLPGELGVWVFVGAQDYAAASARPASASSGTGVAPRQPAGTPKQCAMPEGRKTAEMKALPGCTAKRRGARVGPVTKAYGRLPAASPPSTAAPPRRYTTSWASGLAGRCGVKTENPPPMRFLR